MNIMWVSIFILFLGCSDVQPLQSQQIPLSQKIVNSFIALHPHTIEYPGMPKSAAWDYERGVVLQGVYQVYSVTHDTSYLGYIQRQIDLFVHEDGTIRTYDLSSFNLDNVATGRQLLALYRATKEEKYKKAAEVLRTQLAKQPRTNEGGFWHKNIYPYQMWLDGLYMAEPFYAEYAQMFHEPKDFDDIANQFMWADAHTRDPKTGLLYHGWDESKKMPWANKETGQSPNFWSRAVGWYVWALVDALDYFPVDHPKRPELVKILQDASEALLKVRDPQSKLWYQVLDQGNRDGNYLESSGSCMFVYAFAKGAQKHYLDSLYWTIAKESFRAILDSLVTTDAQGHINIEHACSGAGLGGRPYRDGTFEYYVHEPQRTNDFKAVGPFILAALELEKPFPPVGSTGDMKK